MLAAFRFCEQDRDEWRQAAVQTVDAGYILCIVAVELLALTLAERCNCLHVHCAGLKELRGKMNTRAKDLILGWLKEKGLAPDAKSELGKSASGRHRRQRRALLSPLWLLVQAFEQQQEQTGVSAGESCGL